MYVWKCAIAIRYFVDLLILCICLVNHQSIYKQIRNCNIIIKWQLGTVYGETTYADLATEVLTNRKLICFQNSGAQTFSRASRLCTEALAMYINLSPLQISFRSLSSSNSRHPHVTSVGAHAERTSTSGTRAADCDDCCSSANKELWMNIGLTMDQRRRQWPSG